MVDGRVDRDRNGGRRCDGGRRRGVSSGLCVASPQNKETNLDIERGLEKDELYGLAKKQSRSSDHGPP